MLSASMAGTRKIAATRSVFSEKNNFRVAIDLVVAEQRDICTSRSAKTGADIRGGTKERRSSVRQQKTGERT